jgi:hypothetical protein
MKGLFQIVCAHRTRRVSTGGTAARVQAERSLAKTVSETPYYEGLGDDLRKLRERNHFAESIRLTLRGT